MLIALTGRNGNGKTLYAVSTLLQEKEFQNRPIYYTNIKSLSYDLGWIEFPDPTKWQELPKQSVLFVDEAHKYFPKAKRAGDMPAHIEMMSEHRGDYAVDIIFCTQLPTSIHHHIRGLINRHIHLSRYVDMSEKSKFWEWRLLEESPDKEYQRKLAANYGEFVFPKEAYGLYHSADMHPEVKQKPKILRLLRYLYISMAVVFCAISYRIYSRVTLDEPKIETSKITTIHPNRQQERQPQILSLTDKEGNPIMDVVTYIAMLEPRIPDVPATAPIYDQVYKPVDYPKPSCVSGMSPQTKQHTCLCHSQQGSKMNITQDQCNNYVDNGYFDYAKQTRTTRVF